MLCRLIILLFLIGQETFHELEYPRTSQLGLFTANNKSLRDETFYSTLIQLSDNREFKVPIIPKDVDNGTIFLLRRNNGEIIFFSSITSCLNVNWLTIKLFYKSNIVLVRVG